MAKVLVTPRSFGQYDDAPYQKLRDAGLEIVRDPEGKIYTEEQLKEIVKDVDAIIVGVDPLNADVLEGAKNLKVISKYGVGTDNIDQDFCKAHDIEVTITRGANANAVADYAFALILGVARRMVEIDKAARAGDWKKRTALDVWGKKIGVLGLGAIGKGVVKRAKGFGMDVYGFDIFKDEAFIEENGVTFTSIEEIVKECDFISLHLPLTPETKHVIDKDMLKKAKKNLVLVNTARGGIVDEEALYEALVDGTIYGAGVDVFENEPASESKLLELDNVIVGSHCSASTVGAVDMMSQMAVDNVLEVLKSRGVIQ